MVVWVGSWGVRSKDQTGVPVGIVTKVFPRLVFSREFQSTYLALGSPAIKTGNPPPKQAVRSTPISGRESERKAARINTGLPANVTWMAVASKWVRPGMGTEWWTIPRRTKIAVPSPVVGLSVRWQTYLARQKSCPGLRNVSLKRQISTPCWLRKCSSSSFLPRTPAAFHQARRTALHRSVLLGRAAILGREVDDDLEDRESTSCPFGEGSEGREEPTCQLHASVERKGIDEI